MPITGTISKKSNEQINRKVQKKISLMLDIIRIFLENPELSLLPNF